MPFQKVQTEKLSTSVVRQIELLILRGILRPGERLPSERELSERLGVSRPSLREAIADLQERGLLASRAGAGIFVADVVGSAFSKSLVRLFAASGPWCDHTVGARLVHCPRTSGDRNGIVRHRPSFGSPRVWRRRGRGPEGRN